MKIVHVNVRYGEGGAATVMQTLVESQRAAGHEVKIIYGYGRRALPSRQAEGDRHAILLCKFPRALVNYWEHKLGIYGGHIGGRASEVLAHWSAWADVVHVHVIHSYMGGDLELLKIILENSKAVVWSIHDSWVLTGRCAITGECDGWLAGCDPCRSLRQYPRAYVDNTGEFQRQKHALIRDAAAMLVLVPLLPWMKARLDQIYPNVRKKLIVNGVKAPRFAPPHRLNTGRGYLLISAVNLTDEQKIPPGCIQAILDRTEIDIVTVGKNPTVEHARVTNHGFLPQDEKYFRIISAASCYAFFSTIDMCPTSIMEALVAGVPVVALASRATDELLPLIGGRTVANLDKLIAVVQQQSWWQLYESPDAIALATRAAAVFSADNMGRKYSEAYAEATT